MDRLHRKKHFIYAIKKTKMTLYLASTLFAALIVFEWFAHLLIRWAQQHASAVALAFCKHTIKQKKILITVHSWTKCFKAFKLPKLSRRSFAIARFDQCDFRCQIDWKCSLLNNWIGFVIAAVGPRCSAIIHIGCAHNCSQFTMLVFSLPTARDIWGPRPRQSAWRKRPQKKQQQLCDPVINSGR